MIVCLYISNSGKDSICEIEYCRLKVARLLLSLEIGILLIIWDCYFKIIRDKNFNCLIWNNIIL